MAQLRTARRRRKGSMRDFQVFFDYVLLLIRKSRILTALEHLFRLRIPDRQFWNWEVYSLGSSLRRIAGISWYRRIPLSSDHGIALANEPSKAEEELGAPCHVTWSSWREKLNFSDKRQVLRIQHPWIPYRKLRGYTLAPHAKGTLVFVPHSVPGLDFEAFDLEAFVETMGLLPAEMKPLTFCLQFHDANLSSALTISRAGHRFVSVGNSLSPSYADRFYRTIRPYKYATSPNIGSQLFYCHEFGLKYFLFDPEKLFQRKLRPVAGVPAPNAEVISKIQNAFAFVNLNSHNQEREAIVRDGLGLDLLLNKGGNYRALLNVIPRS